MEALKKSSIYIFAASMYFYHLGAWTYRLEGFSLSQLTDYPADVLSITYAYICVIIVFLTAGVFSAIKSRLSLNIMLLLLSIPAAYESYRIISSLSAYGSVDNELFYANVGVRLSLGVVVAFSIFHGSQLRKSFDKAKQV